MYIIRRLHSIFFSKDIFSNFNFDLNLGLKIQVITERIFGIRLEQYVIIRIFL